LDTKFEIREWVLLASTQHGSSTVFRFSAHSRLELVPRGYYRQVCLSLAAEAQYSQAEGFFSYFWKLLDWLHSAGQNVYYGYLLNFGIE
jgi:hypothetical protein